MGVKQLKLKIITSIALLLTLLFAGAVVASADEAAADGTGTTQTSESVAYLTLVGGGLHIMQHSLMQ